MNKISYQKELEKILHDIKAGGREQAPSLLLHSCCAPCSSYVLEYLSSYFRITVFYYNPNISPDEEYGMRAREQRKLIDCYNEEGGRYPICYIEGEYRPQSFYKMVEGLEQCPEGKERCLRCFSLRLSETARLGAEKGFAYFGTTLTISPLKNAEAINEIGRKLQERMAAKYEIKWLPSDFKKKDGFKRSIRLSEKYGLYRQDYCGCLFSKRTT